VPDVLQLSLQDAIERGVRQNLGLLLSRADTHCARGHVQRNRTAALVKGPATKGRAHPREVKLLLSRSGQKLTAVTFD
jgi:hypothetical protein